MTIRSLYLAILLLAPLSALGQGVVINEILYRAPDDLAELEYVELWNSGDRAVDLSGWRLTGVDLTIPEGTRLAAQGYLVAARNASIFERVYGRSADLEFKKALNDGGERLRLKDASGTVVESVKYDDKVPWPQSADGRSASLERISAGAPVDQAANWAPSSLSASFTSEPSGTPGAENGAASVSLPPAISLVNEAKRVLEASEPLLVVAKVSGDATRVELLFAIAGPMGVGEEAAIKMERTPEGTFRASIPAQEPGAIVRYRVRAENASGAVRWLPHPNELRPAFSSYVADNLAVGAIPVMHFIGIGEELSSGFERYRVDHARSFGRRGFGRAPEPSPDERIRRELSDRLSEDSLERVWTKIGLGADRSAGTLGSLVEGFRVAHQTLEKLQDQVRRARSVTTLVEEVDRSLKSVHQALQAHVIKVLGDTIAIQELLSEPANAGRDPRMRRPEDIVNVFYNVERSWFQSMVVRQAPQSAYNRLREIHASALKKREALVRRIQEEGGNLDFRSLLDSAREGREEMDGTVMTVLGGGDPRGERGRFSRGGGPDRGPGRGPGGRSRGFGRSSVTMSVPPQGGSALVYREPGSEALQFFDFVNILPRKSGYKVRLHKDQPLNGMTTLNVLYERGDATTVNEAMAYPLYRQAGNATVGSGLVRVVMNGKVAGYHVWFEQPNGNFFRRHGIDPGGNLYKVIWQQSNRPSPWTPEEILPERMDLVARYEKVTHPHEGYDDLVELVEALEKAEGDDAAMWQTIERYFDVDQVIHYYAVNLLVSHWDGFFNNYFLYHDTQGTGKWSILPWDQDSTWSLRGGSLDTLVRMPINYGGKGATQPGMENQSRERSSRDRGASAFSYFGGFRGGFGWWRDGDMISSPVIGNPTFQKRYWNRLRELVEGTFSEEHYESQFTWLIDAVGPEARLRAETHGQDPNSRAEVFADVVETMREHLKRRRAFLLSELEKH